MLLARSHVIASLSKPRDETYTKTVCAQGFTPLTLQSPRASRGGDATLNRCACLIGEMLPKASARCRAAAQNDGFVYFEWLLLCEVMRS